MFYLNGLDGRLDEPLIEMVTGLVGCPDCKERFSFDFRKGDEVDRQISGDRRIFEHQEESLDCDQRDPEADYSIRANTL